MFFFYLTSNILPSTNIFLYPKYLTSHYYCTNVTSDYWLIGIPDLKSVGKKFDYNYTGNQKKNKKSNRNPNPKVRLWYPYAC